MHNFKNLQIWQESVDFAVDIHKLTSTFPDSEKFGLSSQMKRASVSIPSNIAEGSGRLTTRDFDHFLNISTGSSFELETQLIIAGKLQFISVKQFEDTSLRLQSIQRKIFSFKKTLNKESSTKSSLKNFKSWFLVLSSSLI